VLSVHLLLKDLNKWIPPYKKNGQVVWMSKVEYINNMNNWRSGFEFFCNIKVRFGETDMFGHLNNANAFVYFEEARVEFFKHIGLGKEWIHHEKIGNVVANIQCDYIRQVYFDEKLKVY